MNTDNLGAAEIPAEETVETVETATTETQPDEEAGQDRQQEVDAAAKEFEQTGQWPENTPPWVKMEVTKARKNERAAKQQLGREREAREAAQKELEKLKVSTPVGKPNPEDFETDAAYVEALTRWTIADTQAQEARRREQAEAEERKQAANQKFTSMIEDGEAKYVDFHEKVSVVSDKIFSIPMLDTVLEADNKADVLYFLANNQQEAQRIAGLSDTQRAIAIGQLSAKLQTQPKPKTSKAPPPINPNKATGHPATVDESKMSDDEWFARRRAG